MVDTNNRELFSQLCFSLVTEKQEKMWDEKVCLEKLTLAKQILEDTITGKLRGATDATDENCVGVAWKSEWQTSIRKWSSSISLRIDAKDLVLLFPCSTTNDNNPNNPNKLEAVISQGSKLKRTLMEYNHEDEISSSSSTSPFLDDRMLIDYCEHVSYKLVPLNLLVWCIRFFVKQLGGRTKHTNLNKLYDNWLFILPQHCFPEPLSSIVGDNPDRGWVIAKMDKYARSLELPISCYLSRMLTSFNKHLVDHTVQNCFSWRGKSVSTAACRFAAALEQSDRSVLLNYTKNGLDCDVILAQFPDGASLKDKLSFKVPAFGASNPLNGSNNADGSTKLKLKQFVFSNWYVALTKKRWSN